MRRRRLYLASFAVAVVTILVRVVVFADEECRGFQCEPANPRPRMWLLIVGLAIAFLLFVAAMLEGALPPDDALPPPDDDDPPARG